MASPSKGHSGNSAGFSITQTNLESFTNIPQFSCPAWRENQTYSLPIWLDGIHIRTCSCRLCWSAPGTGLQQVRLEAASQGKHLSHHHTNHHPQGEVGASTQSWHCPCHHRHQIVTWQKAQKHPALTSCPTCTAGFPSSPPRRDPFSPGNVHTGIFPCSISPSIPGGVRAQARCHRNKQKPSLHKQWRAGRKGYLCLRAARGTCEIPRAGTRQKIPVTLKTAAFWSPWAVQGQLKASVSS